MIIMIQLSHLLMSLLQQQYTRADLLLSERFTFTSQIDLLEILGRIAGDSQITNLPQHSPPPFTLSFSIPVSRKSARLPLLPSLFALQPNPLCHNIPSRYPVSSSSTLLQPCKISSLISPFFVDLRTLLI